MKSICFVVSLFRRFEGVLVLKILLFLLTGLLFNTPVFATNSSCSTDMNVGTYVQAAQTAGVTLSYSSNISGMNGLSSDSASKPAAGVMSFTQTGLIDTVTFSAPADITLSGPGGCTIQAKNFTFENNSVTVAGSTKNVGLGMTLNISGGFCKPGTYSGTVVVPYSWSAWILIYTNKGEGTVSVPISVELKDVISIENTRDMNFGTILSPSTNSTVTLNPGNDSYDTTGDVHFLDSNVAAGSFKVTGVANRNIYLTLPTSAELVSEGGDKMNVNNFTSDTASPFTLTGSGISATKTLNVGGTLHINSRQKPGDYSGSYSVIVTY